MSAPAFFSTGAQSLMAPGALEFFDTQPASYQRAVANWLHSAKHEQTREGRLAQLVADSAAGLQVAPFRRR